MRELLIATKNQGKFKEIVEALNGVPFKFLFLKDLGIVDDGLVENGNTFLENAFIKAKYFFDKTGILTLGEDSGILVDALPGQLGVKTRRWGAAENANDQEWIEYFIKKMSGIKNRGAEFVCAACLVGKNKTGFFQYSSEGRTRGFLTEKLMCEIMPGIPISSCFIPEGCDKVYAALSVEQKNKISHRGKAMREIKRVLEGNYKLQSLKNISFVGTLAP